MFPNDELNVSMFSEIPFKEKGRGYDGCDCWGIPYLMFRDLRGIELPLYTENYQNTEDAKELAKLINNEKSSWDQISKDDRPEIFDVVIIRLENEPMHCGVYIGNGKFIHCRKATDTSINRLTDLKWRYRIVEFNRYRK